MAVNANVLIWLAYFITHCHIQMSVFPKKFHTINYRIGEADNKTKRNKKHDMSPKCVNSCQTERKEIQKNYA